MLVDHQSYLPQRRPEDGTVLDCSHQSVCVCVCVRACT